MRQLGTLAGRLQINWLDVAIAAGLSALAVAQGLSQSEHGGSAADLLCTVPLLLRRRWPIPVLLVCLVGFGLSGNNTGLAGLSAGLIATVSVGLYAKGTPAWLAVLGSAIVLTLEFGFRANGNQSTLPVPPFLLPVILLGAAFLAGREIAARQQQLTQERQRAAVREREQEAAVKAAAEDERRHIARELHDIVAHSVSVMVVQAGAARKVLDDKPEAARESLIAVEASGHEAMDELRRLLGVLSENGAEKGTDAAPLAPQPGLDSLDALVARVREAGLPVELRIDGERRSLPPGVDVAAYRIVQEALTNALKYAGGARTEVVLRYTPDAVDLEVVDEGMIATAADGIGRGLVGMEERVALFGGTLDAGKRPERGYAVRAHLPLTPSE
ncbi:MAG TPA: histidine kinase [Candidatus Angelobacter sp.]|nr:histidine kinase [Candidatus Angelobacter sp.]